MALSEANNWEKHLPDLPSYKKYTELDNVVISGDGNKYCKENLGSTDEVDKTFCNKIAKNLSILKDENVMQKRKYGCYYFNHWLYDNIGKKYYKGNAKGEKDNVSQNLFNFASLAILQHIKVSSCNGNTFGNPEGWKEEKDLHDYFENHKNIKCNDSDKSKCEKYVNYVTYIKNLYEKKEVNCCDGEDLDEYGFCEPYFKCESTYNPKDLLTKLQKELQALKKKLEAGGAEETLQAEKSEKPGSEKSGQEETKPERAGQEKTKPENAEAGASSPKGGDGASAKPSEEESGATQPGARTPAPAIPVEEKAATTIPTPPEPALVKPAPAKPVAAKPPAEKPIAPESGEPKPVAAKPVASKPEKENLEAAESEKAKPAAAKPVAVKPKETVSEEESAEREEAEEEANEEETVEWVTVEEVTTEDVVTEMTSTVQHEEGLGPQTVESFEQGIRAISSHNAEPANNALPLTITDTPNTLGTAHEGLDSNFFRNVIMAIASSRLESSLHKKKKKKGKIFEHNYYEEYEKELAMYGSEETILDSETDRLYLNYHPDQDSYY
ncbi:PIR protein [Plasmodium vivax]|nr:PIR protein [Plasmodium vivax]